MGYFNTFGQYVYDDNELYHHGVERQKWGVRNGPPYPLRPGQASAAEVRAGWKSSVADAKDDYKKKKQAYKQAKRVYKAGKLSKAADRTAARVLKQKIKEAKQGYKATKATGDEYETAISKNELDAYKKQYKAVAARVKAYTEGTKANKMTLEEAKKEFDLAKEKLKVEKQLAGVDFKSRAQRLFDAIRGKDTTFSEIDYDGGTVIIDKATKNFLENSIGNKKIRSMTSEELKKVSAAVYAEKEAHNEYMNEWTEYEKRFDSDPKAKSALNKLINSGKLHSMSDVSIEMENIKPDKELEDARRKYLDARDNLSAVARQVKSVRSSGRYPNGSREESDSRDYIERPTKASKPEKSEAAINREKEQRHKESIQNQLAKARNKDIYQLDFLEAVQNDDFASADHYNRQKMLSEYKKYLQDPEKYMTTHNVKY